MIVVATCTNPMPPAPPQTWPTHHISVTLSSPALWCICIYIYICLLYYMYIYMYQAICIICICIYYMYIYIYICDLSSLNVCVTDLSSVKYLRGGSDCRSGTWDSSQVAPMLQQTGHPEHRKVPVRVCRVYRIWMPVIPSPGVEVPETHH